MNHPENITETCSLLEGLPILDTHPSGRQNREVGEKCPVNTTIAMCADLIQEPRFESACIGTIENKWNRERDAHIINTFKTILQGNPSQPCIIFIPIYRGNTVDDFMARFSELGKIAIYPTVRRACLSGEQPIFALFGFPGSETGDHRYFKDFSGIDTNSLLGYLDHKWEGVDKDNLTPEIIRQYPIVQGLIKQARDAGVQGDDQTIVQQIKARKVDETLATTEEGVEKHGTLNTLCIDWDGTLFGEMRNESPINIDMLDEALEKAQEHNLSLTIWTGGGWETIQKIYATPELKQYFEKYPWLHVVHKSDCRGWTIPHVYDDSTTEELQTTYGVTIQNHHGLGDMHGQVARNIERQRQAILKQLPI